MMKAISLIIIVFTTLILMNGCYYDSEEDLFPQDTCDTTNVSFNTQVLPIIQFNCLECHGEVTSTQHGTFRFVSYDDIKAKADSIVGAISWESPFLRMPDNRPKLDQCKIDMIRAWVNAGAEDN
jgi:hypothetical protein